MQAPGVNMAIETVWVGDATCKGTHASAPGLRYSSLVCRAEGWVEHNFAVIGSGFLNPPTTFAAQIGQAKAAVNASKVGYVFIMGGVDDSSARWGLQDIRSAAASCVDEARKAFPQARIVVGVGPSCIDKDPKVQHRRDMVFASIRMGAKDRNAMVIAHMERVCGSDPGLTADGQHPNNAGYKLLAQRIIQAVTTAWPPEDRPVEPARTYLPGNLDWMLTQDRRAREQEKSKREANRPTATETGQTTERLNELTEVLDVQQELLGEQQKALARQQETIMRNTPVFASVSGSSPGGALGGGWTPLVSLHVSRDTSHGKRNAILLVSVKAVKTGDGMPLLKCLAGGAAAGTFPGVTANGDDFGGASSVMVNSDVDVVLYGRSTVPAASPVGSVVLTVTVISLA